MHTKYALLAIILLQTLCASAVSARGSAITGRASLTAGTTSPCTLDVVLVTFRDATAPPPMSRTDCGSATTPEACAYHNYDRPYGDNPGESSIHADSSYTRRDFERLFSGGYDGLPDFVGTNETVGAGHRLPEVFGSVRAYYDSVSNGAFQLHVRIINPADDQGYPRWVELPETKAHYAEIEIDDRNNRLGGGTRGDWFWDDAYTAAQAAVDVWYPDTDEYDLPNDSYDTARRLRHKVLYLYSGATYTARSPAGLLHPQADRVTVNNPTAGFPRGVGYRYVMGEREGWGHNDHDIDEFAGIGTHAHEIGHLLGLNHGDGLWEVATNRYDRDTSYTNDGAANMLGWTLMQGGGEQGPELEDNGYSIGYRSCPNPINPFYLMDLGWLNPSTISESRDNYAIAAGTTHRIDRGGISYLLNRRTTQPFGGRYLAFYDYAGENRADQGLMIWRREIGGEERPILIVADERRYEDARDRQQRPRSPEYFDMLSDPFLGTGNITAVDALIDSVGLRQKTYDSIDGNGNPRGENIDPGRLNLALTNMTYNRATDTITVDIYMAPPGPPTHVTAVVTNEQATLSWHRPAPTDSGPQPPPPSYEYRQSTDGGSTWGAATAVAEGSTDARSQTIALVPDTDYLFEVRAVNPLGSSDWVRPSQRATPQAVLTSVSFGSATYQALEGGDAVPVVVRLSPLPSQPVRIPVQVSADAGTEADDYTVAGLTEGSVSFAAGASEQSFSIKANEDADSDNETVSLSFETLGTVVRATPEATVTLLDNDATVALSSLSPQVGTPLTAELADPSGGITNPRWQWQRRSSPTAKWINAAGVSSQPLPWVSIYLPQAGDVGDQLRATVGYTAADGTSRRAESTATAAVRAAPPSVVNRPPSVPLGPDVVSVAENTTSIGTYISADLDGDALGWTVSPAATFSIRGGALRFKNAPDYESGTTVYTATLQTYDGALWSPAKTVTVRVTDVNERPSAPSGPGVVSVAENTTAIGTYTSTDPEGDALGWTVSPAATFSIRGGALRFKNAPDYESGTTVYTATLKTYDGALWSPAKTVTVRVTDVDEDPVVPKPLAVRDLASRATGQTSGQASWKPPRNASAAKVRSYRYRLDGGTIQTTTSTSASFSSLQSGRRYSVDVWAVGSSGAGTSATTTFTTESGVAPVLDPVGPLTCYVGEYCSFTFPTARKGTAPITYKVSPPSWARASGRSFSGTAPSSPGTASASLNASNAYGTDSESLTINVKKRPVAGVAPVLPAVSSITCYVGEYCSFTFPAATSGTAPITYKVSAPSWARASGRSFSGTAPSSPGTASASLNASNAYGTDSESLTINVKKRGYPPVLASVSSITCYVGEYCSFTFPAATSGTAPITYKVSAPSWASASGRSFSGTAPSSPGTASASLNASNAYGTDSESLTINVKKRGYPPVLASVSSITCYVGEYCSFTFPAATSGTSPISYTVSAPSWARASGRGFSGTAPSSPGTASASINASNSYGTDSESLTINVKKRLAMAPRHSPEFSPVPGGQWLAERTRPLWSNMDGARYGWRYRLLRAIN